MFKGYKNLLQEKNREYNNKFKKWTPVRVAAENTAVSNVSELKYFYNIYEQNKKKGK